MATSFISEHSSEYILVAKLAGILNRQFDTVIPIYFLSTREGGLISSECSPSRLVKIVSVFARRPKVNVPNQPYVEVKFNESLFKIAGLSSLMGIPTFAGIPLASSIMDLNLAIDCAWFQLTGSEIGDVAYEIALDGKVLHKFRESSAIEGPLSQTELIGRVSSACRSIEWGDAIEKLRTIRRGTRDETNGYPFGGGYHPFHLMLLD